MKDCIKKVRKNKNWTQQHLADVSGINVSVISRAERGVTKPGPETLMALEQALGTSLGIRSFGLSYKERKKFYTERGRTLSEGFQFLQFLMDNMRGKSNDKYERVAEEILSHSNLDSINKISGEKNLQTLCEAFLSLEDKGEPVRFLIMSLQDCLGLVFPEVLCIDQYISCWGAEIILLDYSPIICLGENWKPGEWDRVSVLEDSIPEPPIIPLKKRLKKPKGIGFLEKWAKESHQNSLRKTIPCMDFGSLRNLFEEIGTPLGLLINPKGYVWFRKLSKGFFNPESSRENLEKGLVGVFDNSLPILVKKEVPDNLFYLLTEKGTLLVHQE